MVIRFFFNIINFSNLRGERLINGNFLYAYRWYKVNYLYRPQGLSQKSDVTVRDNSGTTLIKVEDFR